MRKVFIIVFILIILALFLLFYFNVFNFNGKGGSGGGKKEETEDKDITITIVVEQDRYMIDGQEVTLSQIKEKVTDTSETVKVVLENNYASVESWDNIKTNLADWGVTPIEE